MGNGCCGGRDHSTEKNLRDEKELERVKKEIEKQFNAADKDSNKTLSFEELYRLALDTNARLGLNPPKREEIKKLFIEGDQNKDGKLSLQEYTDLMLKHLDEIAARQRALAEEEKKKD